MQLFEKVGDYAAFDRVLRDTLTAWPVETPPDWIDRVNLPENEKELDALRQSVERGRPYGAPEWQKRISKRLGLESSYRSAGRPSKTKRHPPLPDP
jgi:putative transposase